MARNLCVFHPDDTYHKNGCNFDKYGRKELDKRVEDELEKNKGLSEEEIVNRREVIKRDLEEEFQREGEELLKRANNCVVMPDNIERIRVNDIPCWLGSWRDACNIWSNGFAKQPPDLIISDINFRDDNTSPMSKVVNHLTSQGLVKLEDDPLPSGLLHVKPLAAIAASLSRPIGFAIHTVNPDIWEKYYNFSQSSPNLAPSILKGNEVIQRYVGALAIHEIGELAAIRGYNVQRDTTEETVKECLKWFKKHHQKTFETALPFALGEYLGELIEASNCRMLSLNNRKTNSFAFVMPCEWIRLNKWTQERINYGGIINNEHITLTYRDGTKDPIYLASMFATAETRTHETVKTQCWPKECFQVGINKVSSDFGCGTKRPQFGEFINSLKSLYELDTAARLICDALGTDYTKPIEKGQPNINKIASNILEKPDKAKDIGPVKGLAVLYQAVKLVCNIQHSWQELLNQPDWDYKKQKPCLRKPKPTYVNDNSLYDYLNGLLSVIDTALENDEYYEDGYFTWEEIVPKSEFHIRLKDCSYRVDNGKWWEWHMELLVSAKKFLIKGDCHLNNDTGETETWYKRGVGSVLKSWMIKPRNRWEVNGVEVDFSNSYSIKHLNRLIHVGDDDSNTYSRCLDELVGKNNGKSLLDQVFDGSAPGWIMELLREYYVCLEKEMSKTNVEIEMPYWLR